MDKFSKKDMEDAIQAITSMIERSEKAQIKFGQGTSQHTLQKNRIKALYIALSLIKRELSEGESVDIHPKEDIGKSLAPINSLISKSEKAQTKLKHGTWQHTMLNDNLKALYIALPLLHKELGNLQV